MEEQDKSENQQPVAKKKRGKKVFIGIIGIIVLLLIVNSLSSDPQDSTEPASTDSVQVDAPTDTSNNETQTETTAPAATMGEQNALSKAGDYLSISAFSYFGLISQLEYEGFSTEEATYAVDNCGADWNEQAEKKAKEYINISSFSRSGLIDQLKYEGFTTEQAEYGATAIGY